MSEEKKGRIAGADVWWPRAIAFVALAAVLVAGGLGFYFLRRGFDTVQTPLRWPEKAALGLSKMLQGEVKIDGSSFTVSTSEISELALLQRRIICTTKYESTYLRSKATVIIRGVFTVKAGYDLSEPHRISYDEAGAVIRADMPAPKILSITTDEQKIFFVAEGLVNELEPAEMEKAYAENLAQARREAEETGMLKEAESRIRQRLEDVLSGVGARIEMGTAPEL